MKKKYYYEIDMAKKSYINTEILLHKGDQKYLFKLVSGLLGIKDENPLPQHESNIDLTNDFANFFHSKITTIRDNLNKYPLYSPPPHPTGNSESMAHFHQVDFTDINKQMKLM